MAAATLADVLRHRAFTDADRIAYAFGGDRLTYGELLQESLRLAETLSSHGIGAGDRVAIVLPAGLEFVRAFWAVQLIGAASAAINPFTPEETTQRRVARVRPHAVIDADRSSSTTQLRPPGAVAAGRGSASANRSSQSNTRIIMFPCHSYRVILYISFLPFCFNQ